MAQIVIDGDRRTVDKLTIVQMPYELAQNWPKQSEHRQTDITLDEIRIALSHVAVCIDPDKYLDVASEFDDFDTSLSYLKNDEKFLALVTLSSKLNGVNYDKWLSETAIPALLKVHGMTKIEE